jgi:hypothetical protein
MQKEQLPANQKPFNVLVLYLEADQLMTNLKAVIMELRDGAIALGRQGVKLQEEIDKLKAPEEKKE